MPPPAVFFPPPLVAAGTGFFAAVYAKTTPSLFACGALSAGASVATRHLHGTLEHLGEGIPLIEHPIIVDIVLQWLIFCIVKPCEEQGREESIRRLLKYLCFLFWWCDVVH